MERLPGKCHYSSNGYHFDTALLLSVFLGMFGVDRFYLGYPAIGLLKFCTLGFMFLGQLVDVILIATQVVGPADGSAFVIPFYGPGITVVRSDNWTWPPSPAPETSSTLSSPKPYSCSYPAERSSK